jgi:pimeloyl-ACP methyl ester carboxylesterase
VIAVDMPGFGKSEKPDPEKYNYGQSGRNRHMIAFIEAIAGPRPAYLIGNSMGGATALGVTIARPDLVRKLVLMGAAGLDISNPDPAPRKALASYDYTPEGMRRLVSVLAGPNYKVDDDLVQYRYELTMQPGGREAMAAIHEHMKTDGMTYPREQIASVQTPTLVVGGKLDQIAVLARTYGYLELIPNSWGFVLPHCGHWVMMEAPEEFVAVTTAFCNDKLFTIPQ